VQDADETFPLFYRAKKKKNSYTNGVAKGSMLPGHRGEKPTEAHQLDREWSYYADKGGKKTRRKKQMYQITKMSDAEKGRN